MFGITDIWAFVAGAIVIILLPGPNSLYCLATASANKKSGIFAMLGILLGDSVLILATVLGAGTLLRLYPALFNGIKLIGGAYLAYLGVRLLLSAKYHYLHFQVGKPLTATYTAPKSAFYKSLGLSLTNPKAILFFLSFFVQFVSPTYDKPLLSFFVLAVILQAISFGYLSLLIVAGKTLADKFRKHKWLVVGSTALVGCLFVGFAVNLWLSQI